MGSITTYASLSALTFNVQGLLAIFTTYDAKKRCISSCYKQRAIFAITCMLQRVICHFCKLRCKKKLQCQLEHVVLATCDAAKCCVASYKEMLTIRYFSQRWSLGSVLDKDERKVTYLGLKRSSAY